jgi:hypothetical protein
MLLGIVSDIVSLVTLILSVDAMPVRFLPSHRTDGVGGTIIAPDRISEESLKHPKLSYT